jgi:uncharacterized protein
VAQVALVTGASSGLGDQFARQLSERGYELVLVARRVERLEQLAGELSGPAHVVGADLITEAAQLKPRVDALGLEVDVLVNNAGFGSIGRFHELDGAREAEQVRLNCEAVVTLTSTFLPGMVERGRGGVITVASTAGYQPIPYQAVYSASKAFARTFSDALHHEVRGAGVKVLAVNPGPVPTEWQAEAGFGDLKEFPMPGAVAIGADQCVREALDAFEAGKRSIIPGMIIRTVMALQGLGPRFVQLPVTERLFRPRR